MNCSPPVHTNGHTIAATSVHGPTSLVRMAGVNSGVATTLKLTSKGRLSGSRSRSMACGVLFNSVSTIDSHRLGNREGRGANRRCLTPDEMLARGWLVNAKGFWISRRRPDVPRRSGDRIAPGTVQGAPQLGDKTDGVAPQP